MFRRNTRQQRAGRQGEIVVSDPETRARLHFQGLTEEDLGIIAEWEEVCRGVIDRLIDAFYERMLSHETTRAILEQHSSVERQRPLLTQYILTMFSGRIDDAYIEYRRRVERVHDDIDLDSSWYVAMYEVIRRVLVEAVQAAGASRHKVTRFTAALSRLIQADMALVLIALTKAHQAKIEALQQDNERRQRQAAAHFLNEIATVLKAVAACDLTARMQGTFNDEFIQITQDLNTAVTNLDNALSRVTSSTAQVTMAAEQINSGSQSLSQAAAEQASTLQEIASSLRELASTSRQSAANAKEARNMADTARHSADKSTASMQRLSQAIEAIKVTSDDTAKIVKTIDDIAFQTNLLALNAAVEAARAGDAGKGFAVVAEEVRNLAMRSAEAAKNTAQRIQEAVQRAGDGVVLNQEALTNLGEIVTQVHSISEVIGEIATSSEQQQHGIEQLNTAVEQLNQVTQQTAANSEEAASTATGLSEQATQMQHLVSSFQLSMAASSVSHVRIPAPRASAPPRPTRPSVAPRSIPATAGQRTDNCPAPASPRDVIPFDDDQDILQDF
jgi:methyl-accepting chemotaxis protein